MKRGGAIDKDELQRIKGKPLKKRLTFSVLYKIWTHDNTHSTNQR